MYLFPKRTIWGFPPARCHIFRNRLLFFSFFSLFYYFFWFYSVFSHLQQRGSTAVYHRFGFSIIKKKREEKHMEEPHSVNSPRRILSFSKRRRAAASVSFLDPDERTSSGFGVSGEHGPKPSEVYGFVGSITTVVATAIFLVWAYIPEPWLHSVGIFYYPSRYWALAVPTYAMVIIVLAIVFYIGLNFMSTPPSTSLTTIFDEFSREPSSFLSCNVEDDDQPIEPISDLGINKINVFMFDNAK